MSRVEGECGGAHPRLDRLILHAEEFTDRIEDSEIDGRGGAGCAGEGRLINHHHVGKLIAPLDRTAAPGSLALFGGCRGEVAVEDIADQRAFSRAGDTRDTAEDSQRELHIKFIDVVVADPFDLDPLLRFLTLLWNADDFVPAQVGGGERCLGGGKFAERAGEHQGAPLLSASGTEVDDMICRANDGLFMLHHKKSVPLVPEGPHDLEELADITRMQADTRFVHDEERVDERGAEAGGQVHSLNLTARECLRGAVEREVTKPHGLQIAES